ncbi:MAG: zinc-ribbon domain-containing protein [Lentisphaerae bacterium]|jgi:membrane protease subunit (stomatin/prohibitin family)|nr:zinc-ribbon domain-containing protein [Lentisphaerota bacterium]
MAIADIIKYEGDNTTLIWKHPCEDFNYGSQLIVHESQEAVFYSNGQALDSFGPGRHLLSTQNMPIAGSFFNKATGDQTPFHCEVYFINKTEQMAIKWGTDTKMEYVEPTYGFPIQLGACGEMNIRLEDGRKLLIQVVGTEDSFSQEQMTQKFRSFLMIHLKPYIVSLIKENKISIFEIDEYLQSMSQALQEALAVDFQSYGISLERFFITNIIKPEDDKNYRRFKEIHYRQYADIAEAKLRQQVGIIDQQTAAQRMAIEAEGLAKKRSIEGYTYQAERGFDVAERVASNQAVGQFTNMGVGMGMISGIGGSVGNKVGGMLQDTLNQNQEGVTQQQQAYVIACEKCGVVLPANAKFCLECGEKTATGDNEITCPKCGVKVPKGKFCLSCGASLTALVCSKCGKEVPAEAKFCLECGEKLSKSEG